ncbi:transposase [Streptomyces sp. ISL-98]|uniref:transposase n=1 Tax=Streptomyces sp. ISL-98 TaxID=2819192 RepID=UPI0020350D97
MTARRDALFELTDALLCADGPVKTLVGLALAPEHRRGHGALYAGLNHGRLDVDRLRARSLSAPRSSRGEFLAYLGTGAYRIRCELASSCVALVGRAPGDCWSAAGRLARVCWDGS